jgi:transglutaminase-like putative cysteine protease
VNPARAVRRGVAAGTVLPILMACLSVAARPGPSAPAASAPEAVNLVRNGGFESGDAAPDGWRTFPPSPRGVRYVWDDAKRHAGDRSARVEGSGGFGMWQQFVDVVPGRVYVLHAHVAFEDVAPPGRCCLQIVFRDARNAMLGMIDWPGHTGSRDFALDFPPRLKVRAPDGAARAEVNLFLRGRGRAWFDDVHFGPAPTGSVAGTVTCRGKPVPDARVRVWGDPWGKPCEAVTDAGGRYRLDGLPVAYPRYVLLAGKAGYRTRPAGDVAVRAGAAAPVNFVLTPGSDPEDLRVKFGTLSLQKRVPGARIPDGAVIPAGADGYPEPVRPYLEPDAYVRSDHPDVVARAKRIVESLPPADRRDTREVVWAVYAWVSRNIEHDGVFSAAGRGGLETPYRDVTSGIWQTISGRGWCWGRSFLDWCYRPHELLETRGGICVEHAWLTAALLRALNIPARAAVGSHEFYAQRASGDGTWVHGGTTAGRTGFRERGSIGRGYEGLPPETRFAVLGRPVLHEDWNARNPGLWRERHPWGERYEGTSEGREQALADLARFAETGGAPRGMRPPRRGRPGPGDRGREAEDRALQRRPPRRDGAYVIHYSDVTISLLTMGDQRTLDVRFPITSLAEAGAEEPAVSRFWTSQPDRVRRTWTETVKNPPVRGAERWFHIEFDLTP